MHFSFIELTQDTQTTNPRMAIDLMNIAKSYLTDAVVSRVSNSLGESPEGVQKALTGALPIVFGSVISRSSTPEGPSFLGSLLRPFLVNTPDSTTAAVDETDRLMQRGSGMASSLFGPSEKLVAGALAQYAGVKTASASGILGMAGAIVTNAVSQQILSPDGQVDVSSLMDLLAAQKDNVLAAMPAGLATLLGSIPGLDALGDLTGKLNSGISGLKGAAGTTLAGAAAAIKPTPKPVPNTPPVNTPAYSNTGSSGGAKIWPWLVVLVVIGILVYAIRGCGGSKLDSAATTTSTTNDTTSASVQDATLTADTVAASMEAMTDTLTSATATTNSTLAALGDFGGRKLPDGVELNIPAKGIENKLVDFIEDQAKPVDQTTWFNFDRLLYETASAKLKPESREQLQNIAAIMKAYPAVNLKIGGLHR